jgi:hypothetical protein
MYKEKAEKRTGTEDVIMHKIVGDSMGKRTLGRGGRGNVTR